ncbi:sodium:calcium antiporter [Azospirillum sp. sgz301742]
MKAALSLILILAGIALMQWGSQRVCSLLGDLRRHWGIAEVGAGALIGLATASPEISVNIASVVLGWPDIGLGTALGSNVPALPLIFAIAYLSTRWHREDALAERRADPAHVPPPKPVPEVKEQAVWVQVLPYLAVVALLAVLTLTPGWEGLQPVDGLLLAGACAAYLVRALRHARVAPEPMAGARRRILRTLPGIAAIAVGALLAVLSSRRLNEALGISDLVGGLFITGLLCALPESFSAWRLSRSGRATAAVSAAVADGIFSLTLALVPLALTGARVGDVALYALNLGFLGAVLLGYMALHEKGAGSLLTPAKVLLFSAGYGAYLVAAVNMVA